MITIKDLRQFSEYRIRQGVGFVLQKQPGYKVLIKYKGGHLESIRFTLPDYNKINPGNTLTVWKRKKTRGKIAFLSQYALIYYNVMTEQDGISHPLVIRIMDRFGIDDLLNMEVVGVNDYFLTVHKVGPLAVAGIKAGYEVLRGGGVG